VAGTWITVLVVDSAALAELAAVGEGGSNLSDDELVAEGRAERIVLEEGAEDSLSLSCRRIAW
jgi:hypothetical protein